MPTNGEKQTTQTTQTNTNEIDSIRILIEGIDSNTPTNIKHQQEKMTGYVNTNLLEVFPTPKRTQKINNIPRGTKIYIFETMQDWANISADETHAYWVNLNYICFTNNCWNNKSTDLNNSQKASSILFKQPVKTNNSTATKHITTSNIKGQGYINTQGNYVPSPKKSNLKPKGATARCYDGTWSFSQSRRGTCSGHGGVRNWL